MILRILGSIAVGFLLFCLPGKPALAAAPMCSFPHGGDSSLEELLSSIKHADAFCGLPWRALKRAATDPIAAAKLKSAYADIAAAHPDRARGAEEQSLWVDAASGHPEAMLAFYDGNVLARPEDTSLANAACWARGAHGIDLAHAMPYCDAAVAAGRPAYSLVNRGKVALQLGRFAEALADFNEALSDKNVSRPFALEAVYGRGVARIRTGDAKGAEDIELVRRSQPDIAADFADLKIAS